MIGDVIQTTASLEDLRRGFPGAHIAYMTRGADAIVLDGNQNIDEILPYVGMPQHTIGGMVRFLHETRRLRRRRFDLALSLNPDSYDALLLQLMGVRRAVGFVEPQREFLLDEALVWDDAEVKARQTRFDELLRLLGIEPQCRHYTFPTPTRPGDRTRKVIEDARASGKPLLVIAPGGGCHPPGGSPYRQWLPERFAEVLSELSDELGAIPVLIGDSNDIQASQAVLEFLPADKRDEVRDLTGETSLEDIGALLRAALLVVTNDAAPVWIAAAVDCPTVSIFGCNHPTVNMPLSKWYAAVSSELPCHPCYRGDSIPDCDIPPPCLTEITVQDVIDAAHDVLGRASAARDTS